MVISSIVVLLVEEDYPSSFSLSFRTRKEMRKRSKKRKKSEGLRVIAVYVCFGASPIARSWRQGRFILLPRPATLLT